MSRIRHAIAGVEAPMGWTMAELAMRSWSPCRVGLVRVLISSARYHRKSSPAAAPERAGTSEKAWNGMPRATHRSVACSMVRIRPSDALPTWSFMILIPSVARPELVHSPTK